MRKINSKAWVAIGVLSAGMTSSAIAEEERIIPDKDTSKQLAVCAAYFYHDGYFKGKESSRISFDSIIDEEKRKADKAFAKAVLYGGKDYAFWIYSKAFQVIKKEEYQVLKYGTVCEMVVSNFDYWIQMRKEGSTFSCESEKSIRPYREKARFKLAIPAASTLNYGSILISQSSKSDGFHPETRFYPKTAVGFITNRIFPKEMKVENFIATKISTNGSSEKTNDTILQGFLLEQGDKLTSLTIKKINNQFGFYLYDSEIEDEVIKGSCKKVSQDVFLIQLN